MSIGKILKDKRDKEVMEKRTSPIQSVETMEIVNDSGEIEEIEVTDIGNYDLDAVTTLNTLSGDLNLIPGVGISIDLIGDNTIRINNTYEPEEPEGPEEPEEPSGKGKYDIGWNLIDFESDFELFNIEEMIN